MRDSDMRDFFRASAHDIRIDEDRRKTTMSQLKTEIDAKKFSIVRSRRQLLKNQFRYADKTMLWVQALGYFVMAGYIGVVSIYGMDQENMIVSAMILSGIQGVFSIFSISRMFSSNMAELGESCFFNVKQMTAVSMVYSGIISLVMLFLAVVFISYHWKLEMFQAGLYVAVPFVFAECCCLGAILTETGRRNPFTFEAAGMFVSIFYIMIASIPGVYQVSAITFWCIALMAGVVLLGVEIKILYLGIERGEILCMN